MKTRILLHIFSLLILLATVASADSNQDTKQSGKQINSTIVAFNNLSLAIDFWHDASLKGNRKAVLEHTEMIHEIISEDIKDSYTSISYAKLEASYSKEKNKDNQNNNSKIDEKHDFKNNKRDLQNEESVLNAKKMLLSALKKSKSFGYSYRLLADYLQLLKQELDAEKIELAGDDAESNDDVGKVRFIR